MIPKELFTKIRKLEIRTKGMVHNVFGGEYQSAFKGQGIEFSEVRPYQVGDDVRSIDWNVSARTGETYIKVYEEEREQTLMLAVDVSGSGEFGTQNKFKREIAAEIAAIAAFSAIQNGDKVGLLLFSDVVELFVPPSKGRRHVLRLLREMFAHEASSPGTSIDSALTHLHRTLKRRSIIMLMSDFMDDGYEKPLRALATRHDVVAIHLQDLREEELPAVGLLELTDAETGDSVIVDSSDAAARDAFAHEAYARRAETEALLRRARVDTVGVRTDEDYVEPLIRFFRARHRRR